MPAVEFEAIFLLLCPSAISRSTDRKERLALRHCLDSPFPAKNPEEFEQFFLAMAGSKPGAPSPGDAPRRESVLDHAGSAASELRDEHLLRREQLQVRHRGERHYYLIPIDAMLERDIDARMKPFH
jgi:hypothetical protein